MIKNLIPPLKYNPDTLFTMVFIKENKNEKLSPQEVKKVIAFMPLDEFLNYLNYIEKDAIEWLFKMNNFVSKNIERKQI